MEALSWVAPVQFDEVVTASPSPSVEIVFPPDDQAGAALVTVVVPTRNEAGNIEDLLCRLGAVAGQLPCNVIFVDDSTDCTPQVIAAAAAESKLAVTLIHRAEEECEGGLGGAVVAGLRASRTPWVCVMDGDLQHPPELIPQLFERAILTESDVVVASRYADEGDNRGLNAARLIVSHSATAAARLLFPRLLRGVSDPMSGFFLVRKDRLNLNELRPRGFKILLEILVRSPGLRMDDVGFEFGDRQSGESKATLQEGMRYLRHISGLRLSAGPTKRTVGFAAVGATGLIVNQVLLWAMAGGALGLNLLVAAFIATQGSSVWNFVLADRFVFAGSQSRSMRARFFGFMAVNNVATLVLRLPLLAFLVSVVGIHYLISNLITLILLFSSRFVVSDRFIWKPKEDKVSMDPDPTAVAVTIDLRDRPSALPSGSFDGPVGITTGDSSARPRRPAPRRGRRLGHLYDVNGLVAIASEIPLKELQYFRQPLLERSIDVEIRVGAVGRRRPRSRAMVQQAPVAPASVSYEEHLGRLGANFQVDMGDRINITAGPLLARSPHVLYTNVVEALLRFVLASQDRILLHSATIVLEGRGVMLSAKTDTGKTSTILRLLREHGGSFLSDDMTIVEPNGLAHCYPKPLTISAHTLAAVKASPLRPRERAVLRVQSQVHSKSGRSVGSRLGDMNIPIMAINSLTQMVIPPPKYMIDRLVPCDIERTTRFRSLFLIERGVSALEPVPPDDALDILLENTDDAYGFPPFRYFAPAIVIGDDDYTTLRSRERDVLRAALDGVTVRRLARDDFGWADAIPMLARQDAVIPGLGNHRRVDGGVAAGFDHSQHRQVSAFEAPPVDRDHVGFG